MWIVNQLWNYCSTYATLSTVVGDMSGRQANRAATRIQTTKADTYQSRIGKLSGSLLRGRGTRGRVPNATANQKDYEWTTV